ncbi:unnamed protein product [Bemisia tabaci]|uniref:AB hydrolase-1 domain-containing protein n=1 Tax=Bemisia tabaci TaxID=7038 RepID=A0A9P0AF32_BEMTA|nr:unnamed protein product [Bemisia tabaci]
MLSRFRISNYFASRMRQCSLLPVYKEHNFYMEGKVLIPIIRSMTSSPISIPVPWGCVEGKTWGNNHNAPVLAVHGRQDNCGTFDRLIPMLPQEYLYVCIDLPGHGKSSPFPSGTTLKFFDYVLTMKRVVEYFNWKEFTCLGHSFGADLSLYLGAIYPELVKNIIALETGPDIVETHQLPQWYREQCDQLLSLEKKLANRSPPSYSHAEATQRMKKNRWFSELTDEACNILLKRSLVSNNNGFYFSTDQRFKIGVGPEPVLTCEQQISVFKQVKCPTLIVMADNTVKEYWEKNKAAKPMYDYFKTEAVNTKVVIVNGNHDVHLNHPERVFSFVSSFLSDARSKL